MPETKSTAAELRAQAEMAEFTEYWEKAITRQKDRIDLIKAKIADKQRDLAEAEKRLAEVVEAAKPTPENVTDLAKKLHAVREGQAEMLRGGFHVVVPTGTLTGEGK